ncbi:MAG: methylenetetrahydrofolate reductase [NAD(P)H] [Cyclobacteriaceae bacterium]|nr:methylenetetrahydrofolate reductase [NAD(P)H] [Cyclobacteriaceae bacterium]
MKIKDLLNSGEKTYSFEFFPPKNYSSILELGINVGQLMKLSPSFISVTYGAGGSTQDASFHLIDYINNKIGLVTMAHYTCVNATKEKVTQDLDLFYEKNIENLILLRGDPPKGETTFSNVDGDFHHANDLIEFVAKQDRFCIAAAGYPEAHPESISIEKDIEYLKYKVDKGVDFVVTQLFFENAYYFDFVNRARKAGVTIPIIPGIMPITNFKQIKKFTLMCGAKIPEELVQQLEPYQDDRKKTYKIGVDFAIKQCRELIEKEAPGLHFYTLNKSRATVDIFASIK